MSEQMQQATVTNDEISLLEILRVLKQYKWLLLAATVFGILVGLAIVTHIRPVWEASAYIQVGQFEQQLIEPIPRTVARLKSPIFMHQLFNHSGIGIKSGSALSEQSLYKGSLKAKQLPDTDLIEIKLRAYSNEKAKSWILATVNQLCVEHVKMTELSINNAKLQIEVVGKNLQAAKVSLSELQQRLTSGKVNDVGSLLYVTLYQQKMTEIREMEQRKLTLEEQLNPVRTFPTMLLGEILVSDQPVSPKKGLFVFLAALSGFLGAVCVAFMHNFFRKAKH